VVEKETGEGMPKLTVEAIDKDFLCHCHDRLGAVSTNENGSFEILYDKEDFQNFFFEKNPDIFIRIKSPGGEAIHTTVDKVCYPERLSPNGKHGALGKSRGIVYRVRNSQWMGGIDFLGGGILDGDYIPAFVLVLLFYFLY
jgi:hypothetical protein